MKRALVLLVILFGLLPATVAAQGPADAEADDVLIRINGAVHVSAGETAQGVVVIGDNAVIDGAVEYLVVINGDARIGGTVERQVYIVNGTVALAAGAPIGEEVLLYNADAIEQPGATVAGGIHDEWGGFTLTRGLWFGFWLSMTVAALAAGLLFAAFGGQQLHGAAGAFTGAVGPTLLTAAILWIGVPFAAVLVMATVVGIPLGFGIFLFLLPVFWFLGYLVAGAAVGGLIVKPRAEVDGNPYLPVLVGLLIFQVIALVPFVGGAVAFFAGLVGAGALVYRAVTAWRGATTSRPAFPSVPAASAG